MNPLDLVKLTVLMELTSGRPEIGIGLIDGPIAVNHPDFSGTQIHEIPGGLNSKCIQTNSIACTHGTFVAGILGAQRHSSALAICPNCTLLVRPIFTEATSGSEQMPSASPEELAAAIIESINAGARVLNMSIALAQPSSRGQRELEEALDYALKRGVVVVAAAGNQGSLGSSVITRHPWVIPVIACDLQGRPINQSNLGNSTGKRGLSAPGDNITSLGVENKALTLGGTSVATPFVTGSIALLWSLFPNVTAAEVKFAVTQAHTSRRATVVPPLLDAWAMYQVMLNSLS
ncbi:MAG: S8 family serine peptidase [Aulosira sp. DedQUE10]|nr:S8 family serine peptidase [Aulosira sp. DedQUE10]